MLRRKLSTALIVGVGAIALAAGANAETRGVTNDAIVLGSHSDLSGVAATWGTGSVNAMRMRFEEVNAEGGVHGRKINFIVEDSQYQVPRAVQAANKLLNRDEIFAMVGALGTPMNNAVLKRQLDLNVPNLFPFSAARQMSEPFHKLKFQGLSTYYDQMRAAVKFFSEQRGRKAHCVMYQDTDFGREIELGVKDQLKAQGMTLASESAHKPTDTDFTAALAKHREAGCDLIHMGTIVRDTIIPYATARKMGWDVEFVGSIATYDSFVAGAEGGVTEGYQAMTAFEFAYQDHEDALVRDWYGRYKERFGKDPNQAAQLGYIYADMVVLALDRAGRDLTVDSLVQALEGIRGYRDIFGGPVQSFGPDKRRSTTTAFLAVVKDGRWVRATGTLGY